MGCRDFDASELRTLERRLMGCCANTEKALEELARMFPSWWLIRPAFPEDLQLDVKEYFPTRMR